jgi:hypothetical protein
MVLLGLLVTLLGFVVSLLSVGLASGTGARLAIVLLGVTVSLAGIIGILNPAYVKKAIWRQ